MIRALIKISSGITGLTILLLLFASVCRGQEEDADDDRIVKDAGNPVTSVINLPVQDNVRFGLGEYDRTMHVIKIQPVRLSFQAGRLYKIRSRTIIPLIYAPDITKPTGGVFGLGDIVIAGFFSPNRLGRYIWGAGPAISFPTATDRMLGSGKWSAGVSLVLASQRKRWLAGLMAFNLWSFAGDADRPEVNKIQIDAFFRYHLGRRWMLVSSPTIVADWNATEGEQWFVPVGGGLGRIWIVGGNGLSFEIQAFYSFIHPETLPFPDWSMRFQVQFIGIRRK